MASVSGYNHHRFARSVLKKSRKWEPSLTVELYSTHWKFANAPVSLPYDHPLRPFLLALRSQVIPAALLPFLYEIRPPIAFVDGCLVVQIDDCRRPEKVVNRVVMRPAAEGLAQTIDLAMQARGEPWDEQFALEAESKIINATSAPLYLGTSPVAARNANLALSLTAPAHPSLTADGQSRDAHSTDQPSSGFGVGDISDRMRALLKATDLPSTRRSANTSSGPNAVGGPQWVVIRAKERYDAMAKAKAKLEREKERERAERKLADQDQQAAIASGVQAALGQIEASALNGADGQDDSAPIVQTTPVKPKPKKKKRPAAAAAATADEDAADDKGPPPPANPAPTKKKKSAATKKAEIAAAEAAQAAKDAEAAAKGEAPPMTVTEEVKPKPKGKKKKATVKAEEGS